MKQFASWFTHGVPGGGALRKQIFESKNGDAVLSAVEQFFETRGEGAATYADAARVEEDEPVLTSTAYCD
jgi:hypothetical protein